MKAPMCLIENNYGEKLQVNQEALGILQSIEQPIVVVAIVGLYRTGKSYLMNRLAGKNKGFSLGATIQANTMGIWMWCLPHPKKSDHTLVLLDTEGLGDVEKSNTENDAWIFALSILLSSTLVYNSMGTIDQYALEKLQYVTELTKLIKVRSTPTGCSEDEEDSSTDFLRFFPAFIWAVRDFTLQLRLNGCPISEDQYLENALQRKPGSLTKQDLAKKCIRQYFPSRKCFVFDQPTSRRKLEKLEDLPNSELDDAFVEQSDNFCRYIHETAQAKTIQGHELMGSSLGHLVVAYVEAISSGAIPCLENTVVALAKVENAAAVQDAIACYEAGIKERMKLPTETVEELLEVHSQCEKEAIRVFMSRSFEDENQEYQKELGGQLQSKLVELCSRNEQESINYCQAVLVKLFQDVEQEVKNGRYSAPGGYQTFFNEQKEKIEQYHLMPGKGLMAAKALQDFTKSKESLALSILKADQMITEKQKENEVMQLQAQASAREAELHKRMKEEAMQRAQQQEASYKENLKQLMEKMDQDRKNLQAENQLLKDKMLKEQGQLLREGFTREADIWNNKIKYLRKRRQPRRCVIH